MAAFVWQKVTREAFAMRLASNLLLETKLPNVHLLAASETTTADSWSWRRLEVRWRYRGRDDLSCKFWEDAQQVTTALIAIDATACKGDFVSGRASELV